MHSVPSPRLMEYSICQNDVKFAVGKRSASAGEGPTRGWSSDRDR
jgi:hypothetical protein